MIISWVPEVMLSSWVSDFEDTVSTVQQSKVVHEPRVERFKGWGSFTLEG